MGNRVVLGQRGNGNSGLFVSGPGVDAVWAADSDLVFSTNYGHAASIHQTGIVMLSGRGLSGWVGFPALPYIPLILCGYYDAANGRYYYSQTEISAWAGGTWGGVTFTGAGPILQVYNNQVRFAAYSDHGTEWGVKYHVLRTPGGQ